MSPADDRVWQMIIEGILTTSQSDDSPHAAAMGCRLDSTWENQRKVELRPYKTSQTFLNLNRTGFGVFHIIDDVELLAQSALDLWEALPPMRKAELVPGWILEACCRWVELRVEHIVAAQPRSSFVCQIEHSGHVRDWMGFCRAQYAVVEAAILASRWDILPREQILADFDRLRPLIEKTAGATERRAFRMLEVYLERRR